jgi:hypothetical protein
MKRYKKPKNSKNQNPEAGTFDKQKLTSKFSGDPHPLIVKYVIYAEAY